MTLPAARWKAHWLGAMALIMVTLPSGCAGNPTVESQQPGRAVAPSAHDHLPNDDLCTAFKGYPHGVVFIFVMRDCPIANSYAPEIVRLMDEYRNRGVGFTFVYVDDDVTLTDVRKHAQDYGIKSEVLIDHDRALVRKYGATISPEAALVSGHDELLYRGRIDDRYVDFGKRRAEPSQQDLREALDAVLAGQPVPNPRTPAVGCSITPR